MHAYPKITILFAEKAPSPFSWSKVQLKKFSKGS